MNTPPLHPIFVPPTQPRTLQGAAVYDASVSQAFLVCAVKPSRSCFYNEAGVSCPADGGCSRPCRHGGTMWSCGGIGVSEGENGLVKNPLV